MCVRVYVCDLYIFLIAIQTVLRELAASAGGCSPTCLQALQTQLRKEPANASKERHGTIRGVEGSGGGARQWERLSHNPTGDTACLATAKIHSK